MVDKQSHWLWMTDPNSSDLQNSLNQFNTVFPSSLKGFEPYFSQELQV